MADEVTEIKQTGKNKRVGRLLRTELDGIAARLHRGAEVPIAGVVGGDFLDIAQGVEQQELARLNASRLIEQARRLRLALTRVSNGEYGVCSECGAAIAAKRLLAIPDAVTCVACQDRLERVGAAVRARANDVDDLDTM
jgi:RNA polymerase-binding transcription factor DksA